MTTPLPSHPRIGKKRLLIGIPTRGRSEQVVHLVNSLASIAQPPTSVEVLVVENGPRTQLDTVLGSLTHSFPICYLNEPRLGIPHARNAILEWATDFDYVAFIDDDEVPCREWLLRLVGHLESNEELMASSGPVWHDPNFSVQLI